MAMPAYDHTTLAFQWKPTMSKPVSTPCLHCQTEPWVRLSSKQMPHEGEEVLWACLEDGEQSNHLGRLKAGRVYAAVYGNADEVSWPVRKFTAWRRPGSCL